MEAQLDDISAGDRKLLPFLSTFWAELDRSLRDVDTVTVQEVLVPVLGLPRFRPHGA